MKRNWQKHRRRHAKKKKGSKNRATRLVSRLLASIRRLQIGRRDYQHQLSTRIIRENQVVCVESLQVKNMVKNHCFGQSHLVTSVGVSSSDSWSTKLSGMDVPLSRLTSGTRLPNAALTVDIFLTPYRLMFVAGHVLNVGWSMTVISMLQRTFWPRDSRLLPVERL